MSILRDNKDLVRRKNRAYPSMVVKVLEKNSNLFRGGEKFACYLVLFQGSMRTLFIGRIELRFFTQ